MNRTFNKFSFGVAQLWLSWWGFLLLLLHSYIIQTQHNTHACCHQPRAVIWHIRVVFHRVYKTENTLWFFFYNIIFMLMSWLCVWLFFTHSLDYGFFCFFMKYSICLSLAWDDASKCALLQKVILMERMGNYVVTLLIVRAWISGI